MCVHVQAQLKEMYAQVVYKDHKIVELNNHVTEQDQLVIDMQELVSEKDEVIRGRDMAIQLLQSTIAQQSTKLQDQKALIARITAKVERAEIELNAFHEQLESGAVGEDQKLFAGQLKTIQENFAELLTKKEDEIIELRRQVAKHEETLASEADNDMNTEAGSAAMSALTQLRHDGVVTGNDNRLLEMEAEVKRLKDSLLNKERKLALSSEQLHSVQSELQRLRNTIASSSDVSIYSTCSDTSVELPESRHVPSCEDKTGPVDEGAVWKKDADIPVTEAKRQVDRRVRIVRPWQTRLIEITADELQRNSAAVDAACVNTTETEDNMLPKANELQRLSEELSPLHSLLEAKEVELERLREEVLTARDELAKKEEECVELTESVSRLNESDAAVKQQLAESALSCEGLRKELIECRDEIETKDAELEKVREEVIAGRDWLAKTEERCNELSDLLEESRNVRIEKESLLKASEQEVARLSDLVSTLHMSRSELESSVIVDDLLTEVAEVKKQNEELNSMLAEKTSKLEEVSCESDLLRDAVGRYQNSEHELTTQIETLMEDRLKDLEKFNANMDLVRAEASEKQQKLESMMRALSAKDANVAESLRETESLMETISQLRTSVQSKDDEIERLQDEISAAQRELVKKSEECTRLTESLASVNESAGILGQQLAESKLSCEELRNELTKRLEEIAAKQLEVEKLQDEVLASNRELATKEKDCNKLAETVASLNHSVGDLKEQLSQSLAELTALRTGSTKEFEVKEVEIEKLKETLRASHEQLMRKEDEHKELMLVMEECRDQRQEKENLLEASEREVLRLSDLVLTLQTSHSELESTVTLLRRQSEDELGRSSVQVENLLTEVAEVKKLNEESNSLLAEKTARFEELSRECDSLHETVEKYKNNELELTTQIEALMDDKAKAEEKFSADMDLIRAEASEKEQKLESVIQALSAKDTDLTGRLREIESLTETISQLQTSLGSYNEQIESIRSEAVQKDQELESVVQSLTEKDAKIADGAREIQSLSETVSHLQRKDEELVLLRSGVLEQDSKLESMVQALSMKDEKIATNLTEIESLRESVMQLQSSIQSKDEQIDSLQNQMTARQNELSEKEGECSKLTETVASLNESASVLRQQLTESQMSCEELRTELTKYREQTEAKELELGNLQGEISASRQKLAKNEEASGELSSLLEESRHVVLEKEKLLEKSVQEISEWKRQCDETKSLLADKTSRFDDLSQERDSLQSIVERYKDTEHRLIAENEALIAGKDNDLEKFNAELDLLRTEIAEKDRQLEGVFQTLSEEEKKTAGSLKENESLKETISQLELSILNKNDEIKQQNCVLEERNSELMSYRQKLEEHEMMRGESVNQLSVQEDVIKSLRDELAQAQCSSERVSSELTEAKNLVLSTEAELEELRANILTSRDELTKREDACKELTDLLEKSRTTAMDKDTLLAENTAKFEMLSQEYNLLQETVDKHQKNEQQLMAQMESKDYDLQKITADLDLARAEASAKEQQVEAMIEALSEKDANVAESARQNQSLSDTLSVLQLSLQNKDQEIELLKSGALEKGRQLEDMIQALSEKDASTTGSLGEIESLSESISELQTSLLSKDEEIRQQKLLIEKQEMKIVEKDSEMKNCCRKLEEHEVMKSEFVNQLSMQEDIIKSLRDELTGSNSKVDDTLSQLQLLKMEMSEKDDKISELSDSVVRSNESADVLREQLAKSELSGEELKSDLAEMKRQLEGKEVEIDKLEAAISASRDELAKKEEDCEEMAKSATSLSDSSNVLKEQLAESTSACEELRNELAKCRVEIEAKEVELEKVRDEISGCRNELVEKEQRCKELSGLSMESKDLIAEKENLLGKYVQEVEELHRRNEETNSLLMEKTSQFDELSHEFDLLQDSVVKYKSKEQELAAQIEMLVEGKENDLQKLNAEMQQLRDESAEKDRQLEDAVRRDEELKVSVSEKDEKILQLTESVSNLKESTDVLREELTKSESSCEELRNELAKERDQIEAKDAELENLRGTVSAVHVELAEKKDECRELVEHSRNQLAELEAFRAELMKARIELEAKEAELQKLQAEMTASHTELITKEVELTESVAKTNESVGIIREQFTEPGMLSEELRNESTKDRDVIESQDAEEDRLCQETSVSSDQSVLFLEESGGPKVEKENPLESSVLEVPDSLSRVETLEERVCSTVDMASREYDIVECVGPRYRITSQANVTDGDLSEAMKCWTQFSNLLAEMNVELEQTTLLTRQYLTVGPEGPSLDTHSTVPAPESSHPAGSAATLLPLSMLTTMAENIQTIRQSIEHHECKPVAEFPHDIDSHHTQLSERGRILEEQNRELEAARLEIETSTLRFEKLKAKSIAKIKELSQKHQALLEQKDEELSELRRKLQEQELEIVGLTAKLEAVNKDADDAKEQCLSAGNRIEELEMLLAEKNAQIVAMLEQIDEKHSLANVVDNSVKPLSPPAIVENLSPDEVQKTGDIDSSSPSQTGNLDDVACTPSKTATGADALKSILLNTGQILASLLSVSDSSPSQSCEENFLYVQLYAEQCREMMRDLLSTSELKETRLLAATEELEEKKVLANKYAAAAKKLKQQMDKCKQDLNDVGDQLKCTQEQNGELSSQVSVLQEQCSHKDADLEQLQMILNTTKESEHESLMERLSCNQEEIVSLKEVNAKLEAELSLQIKGLEELRSEVGVRRETELQLNRANEDFLQLLEEKDEQLLKLSAESEANLAKMTEVESVVRQKDAQLSELAADNESELMKLREVVRQKNAQLSELTADNETELMKLREVVRQKDAQLSELTSEAQVNATELMELQKVLRQKDEELTELAAESDADKAKLMHLEETLEAQTGQLDSLFTANQELKNLLHFNDKETGELMESHSSTMQQLVTDLSHSQDKLNEKNLEFDQAVAENRELMQRIDEKDEEIRQCKNNIAVLQQEIEFLQNELEKQNEDLKRNLDELASMSSVHESDITALRESQERLSALQKELDGRCALEVESHRKSCELEDKLHDVYEELNSERLLSEKLRGESEIITAAVRDKDEQLNSLTDQLCSMDDKVKNYEILISELRQELRESSARLCSLESDHSELIICQQQLAEAQTALEQKDKQLAVLDANIAELATQLEAARSMLDRTGEGAEAEKVELTRCGDGDVTMATASVQTHDSISTTDEMSDVVAQNAELTELNKQLLAETTTVRNRLADLEVENCTLQNMLQKPGERTVENSSGFVNTMPGYQRGGDGLVAENSEQLTCRLSELSPVKVDQVTERMQGEQAELEQPALHELMSLKEKYSLLESSHAKLKEELLAERQNSIHFMSIERLKQGLEAENEKNLAEIEALMVTKKKMLVKLKELKASNDILTDQVEDLKQQLEKKSAELSDMSRMTSEIQRLTGCLTVLEAEKKNWLSVEDDLKVMVSSLREELVTAERKHEDEMNKRLAEVRAAADAEKSSLDEQINAVRDELRSKVVDYESKLTSLKSEKNSLETSLEQVKNESAGREEALRQKLADLQTLHDALMSDTESYQQLLEQLTSDNTRLEELLRTRTGTVEELQGEVESLRSELAEANQQKKEFEAKYVGVAEEETLRDVSAENVEQVKCELDSARKENAALLEEIDGLNWKIQDLSEIEQELTQLQAEMFEVQSENGMLKKRLSFVEKEAMERLGTNEDYRCVVEKLEQEKLKLTNRVEQLESEVISVRAQLDARPSIVKSRDAEFQCIEEKLRNSENELERLMERYLISEAENTRLQGSGERQILTNQLEERSDRHLVSTIDEAPLKGSDEMTKHLQVELDELRQRYLAVESDNTRLKSAIEEMKTDNELLHQKVAACRTGSPRPQSVQTVYRQQGSDQMTRHSYQQPVTISFCVV